jgi:hypothetical protein
MPARERSGLWGACVMAEVGFVCMCVHLYANESTKCIVIEIFTPVMPFKELHHIMTFIQFRA